MYKSQHYRHYLKWLTGKWIHIRHLEGNMRGSLIRGRRCLRSLGGCWARPFPSCAVFIVSPLSRDTQRHLGHFVCKPGLSWEAAGQPGPAL